MERSSEGIKHYKSLDWRVDFSTNILNRSLEKKNQSSEKELAIILSSIFQNYPGLSSELCDELEGGGGLEGKFKRERIYVYS